MVIGYVVSRIEEDRGSNVNWLDLIEGLIFGFLYRLEFTDIKTPSIPPNDG